MIKPKVLMDFFATCKDDKTVGKVCMALAGRYDELPEPLTKEEVGYVKRLAKACGLENQGVL